MNILKTLFVTIAGLAFVLAISLGGLYIGGFFKQVNMDINREVTQHSQQYTETKNSLILALITDYEGATDAGRQIAIRNRICEEVTLLIPSEQAPSISRFARANCN